MLNVIRSSLILMIMILQISADQGMAAVDKLATDDYFEFLTRVNQYSPLEHAGSHGTIGVGLGVGLGVYQPPGNAELTSHHWRGPGQSADSTKDSSDRVVISRIHAHKGLPFSVDLGLSIGQEPSTTANLISGYAQWTVYEGFRMPALAVRGSYSRLMALATTDSSAVSGELLASYGFMRYFTIYGSTGVGRHVMRVRTGAAYGTTLALDGAGVDGQVDRTMVRRSQGVGIQLQLLPPFLTGALELLKVGKGPSSLMAKVSIGM